MHKPLFISLCVVLVLLLGRVESRRETCNIGGNLQLEKLREFQQTYGTQKEEEGYNTLTLGVVTCEACKGAIELTRDFIDDSNATRKDIGPVVKFFCDVLKIEDPHVCSEIVVEFEDLFFYLVSDKNITSAFACGVLDMCPKAVFPKWNVTLSPAPPATPYPPPNPKNPSMFVLHLTDIHVDPLYTPGLTSDCGEPLCCRPPNDKKAPFAGKWGDYNCDSPPVLFENMLQWIAKNLPNISYALFTGDMPPHDVWVENRNTSVSADTYVIDTYLQYLPNIAMYPAVGNHESVPVNEFAPRSVTGDWDMDWLYDALAERWGNFLPTAALAQVDYAGYYSTLTPDGVRIISMNTNLGCNNLNWFLSFPSSESSDPDHQLLWFVNTLDNAEKNNEKVYLIMHIAPSANDCGNDWYRNYLNIVERYKNIIMGHFAGHTHDDIFTVSYSTNGTTLKPIITTYFAGSVTPFTNENPGFRVYEIDSVTKAVIDYTEYAMNLTLANIQGEPTWEPIYSARSAYSLEDMSPEAWRQASLKMGTDQDLLYQYWGRMGKNAFNSECSSTCLHDVWCDLWNSPPDATSSICGL